jgi:hypothetical protein
MTVVVNDIGLKDGLDMTAAEDEGAIEALTSKRAGEPLGESIRKGALIGVRTIFSPSERNTSSKPATYFEFRSRMRKRKGRPSHRATRLRACWMIQEVSGFEVTPARCTLRVATSMKNSA